MAKQNAAQTGVNVFNVVRQGMSPVSQSLIPKATLTNIQDLSNILMNSNYQAQYNEFVSNLINRIALTMIVNKSYTNPLALLKKGSIPLGTDIQEIFENPAEGEEYELSDVAMAKVLTITNPDTKSAYYRRNRHDIYTKSIAQDVLEGAFVSWESFNEYVTAITQSLYNGNYIDEFEYTKALVDGAYNNNKVIIEIIDDVINEVTAKKFVKTARKFYGKMKFPSTQYNAYTKFAPDDAKPVKTWTNEDRIIIIATIDVLTEVDVEVLSVAFNIDKTKLMGRIIEVDKFNNPEIKAVICDEAWLQIYDNKLRFAEQFNGRTLVTNAYLHAWSTFAVSPFANAIVLATAKPVPATSIGFDEFGIDLVVGNDENIELTITPVNSTTIIDYKISNNSIASVQKIDNTHVSIHGIAVGETTLTATSDNGLTATMTINITTE